MLKTMDSVYVSSVNVINLLQTRYPGQEQLMVLISQIGDPRYAFTLYFPLVFAFHWGVGKRLLLVAIAAEWMNQILKWVLHGDRPYWWVHETTAYSNTSFSDNPPLQQYNVTCETGPGCPSGHAMAMSAIWYIMISAFITNVLRPSKLISFGKGAIEQLLWSGYAAFILAIILSRVYLATHFPHQCLLGAVIGVYLAHTMNRIDLDHLRLRHYLLATAVVTSTALATYAILTALGSDPLWSVGRALKWCFHKEHVHLDTSPFFSMVRYCGATFGLGLGVSSPLYAAARARSSRSSSSLARALVAAALALLASRLVDEMHALVSKSNLNVFYVYAFSLNALLPFLVTAVVPYALSLVGSPSSSGEKKRKAH